MEDVDWSSLPTDILVLILESLNTVDLVRSKAVCCDWNLAPTRKRSIPWLWFSTITIVDNEVLFVNYQIKSLFEKSPLKKQIFPDQGIGHSIVGSSENGWMLHVNGSHQLRGFNLRTNQSFDAPPYSTMCKDFDANCDAKDRGLFVRCPLDNPDRFYRISGFYFNGGYAKALTFPCDCTRNSKNVTVVIERKTQLLAFAVEGDVSWRNLITRINGFQDIMYFNGLFYGLNSKGQVVTFDFSDPSSPKTKYINPRNLDSIPSNLNLFNCSTHLFELSGEICYLLKHRYVTTNGRNGESIDCRHKVKVFLAKLVRFEDECYEWMEMSGLGDHSLFVGVNNSMCVLATDHRQLLRRNHIYFDTIVGFNCQKGKLHHGEFDLNGGDEQEEEVPGNEPSLCHLCSGMSPWDKRTPWVMPFSI